MNPEQEKLPKFSLKPEKPKRRKFLTAEVNQSGNFEIDSDHYKVTKGAKTSPYKIEKGKKRSLKSLNILLQDKSIIESNRKKTDILMKTKGTLSMMMNYDLKVAIASLLMIALKVQPDYSKDAKFEYYGGYKNVRDDFLKVKACLCVFIIGGMYSTLKFTFPALKKIKKSSLNKDIRAKSKGGVEGQAPDKDPQNAKYFLGFSAICALETIFYLSLVFSFDYIPQQKQHEGDYYSHKQTTENNNTVFRGVYSESMVLLPYLSLILSAVRTTVVWILISKNLYFYKGSFITSICARAAFFLLLLKITDQVKMSWDIFLSINWLILAVFFGISLCLVLYLINKVLRCRLTKHFLFTMVIGGYFWSNSLFIYLWTHVFKQEQPVSEFRGYRFLVGAKRLIQAGMDDDPYSSHYSKGKNHSPLNIDAYFFKVLYTILGLKVLTNFIYWTLRKKMVDYYALFYEDGFFNPFISEKNVIEYEEQEDDEVNIEIPKYIKKQGDGKAVFMHAEDKDWMESVNSSSPKKNLLVNESANRRGSNHGNLGHLGRAGKAPLQRRNSMRRAIFQQNLKLQNQGLLDRSIDAGDDLAQMFGEGKNGRRSSFAIDPKINDNEPEIPIDKILPSGRFNDNGAEINETKIKQFTEQDSDLEFDENLDSDESGENGIYGKMVGGFHKNNMDKYEQSFDYGKISHAHLF